MQLKLLFWLIDLIFETGGVLFMKGYNPGPLTLFLGPLTGILVMSGWVDPKNADDFTQQLDLLVGAIITITTVVSALHHDLESRRINKPNDTTTTVTVAPTVPVTTVTTEPGVQDGGVQNG